MPIYNVFDFGAKGDGQTNDTSAIQASIDACHTAGGGMVLLPPGAVTTFVPNPDHIHKTGVAEDRETVVSLHLYGRMMNSFHVYDVERGTRTLVDVPHQDS